MVAMQTENSTGNVRS